MTSSTFETVAGIISDTADIPREQITPESHAIDDLGIDSLAFLDIAFAIDKAFGIKLPLEQWTQEVNEGKAPAEPCSVRPRQKPAHSGRRSGTFISPYFSNIALENRGQTPAPA